MIENYILEQLVAVAKYDTLSEAAKKLYVTQPALSRSMKKLEKVVGVELFTRRKNFISLNDNGKFAAELAEKILQQNKNFLDAVREFDRKNRTISIGCCAPVPMNELIWLLTEIFPEASITSELNNDDYLLRGLKNNLFQLVIFHENPNDEKLFAKKFGSEKLFIALPPNHKFAEKDGIYLEELNGEKVLLYSKIGFWYKLCKKKAPSAKFLMQTERDTFLEIANSAAFPSFTTDIFIRNGFTRKNCVYKPISDSEASVNYYCTCQESNKKFFQSVFQKLDSVQFRALI